MERSPRGSLEHAGRRLCIASNCGVPPLGETVLHVWTWKLDVDQKCLSQYEDVLCTEEWRRVRRYASHQLARRFIVRRGMLRCILGQYLGRPPQKIRFDYNPHGKPFLAPDLSSDLHFSLSDSGEQAALGVSIGHLVGIDIERLRPVPLVVGEKFHGLWPRELDRFKLVAEPERSLEFFQAWTRREAIAKAEGDGLKLLSGHFELAELADLQSLAPNAARALHKRGFHLHQLELPAGFIGFLATRLKSPQIFYCSTVLQ